LCNLKEVIAVKNNVNIFNQFSFFGFQKILLILYYSGCRAKILTKGAKTPKSFPSNICITEIAEDLSLSKTDADRIRKLMGPPKEIEQFLAQGEHGVIKWTQTEFNNEGQK
jgi:hypothetical protein